MGCMSEMTPEKRAQYAAEARERQRKEAEEQQGARRQFAERVVSHMIDKVSADIIRPGPVPEERECYDMARELRSYAPELIEALVDQLNVNDGCE